MITFRTPLLLAPVTFVLACAPPPVDEVPVDTNLAILGGVSHDLTGLVVEELLTEEDGLNVPRDLEFHPQNSDELWVINKGDNSMVIAFATGTENQSALKRDGFGNSHFMPSPAALAFGTTSMATIHEIDVPTQPSTPANFMGPTLWTSDVETFDAGADTHMDMLHNSPDGKGIAWDHDNVFWAFDGAHAAITRYDFGEDHGPGMDDHSDGVVERAMEGEVAPMDGVPSHLELDQDTGLLYIADTGNHRILALDTSTGTAGPSMGPNYDGGIQRKLNDCIMTTLAEDDGDVVSLQQPSGLALHDDKVFITDFESGHVRAFSKDGEALGWLDTGLANSIMGIDFDIEGRMVVTDSVGNRVLRLSVP